VLDGEGVGVKATPRPLYPREREPIAIVQMAGWARRTVRTGVKKRKALAPTGVLIPTVQSVASRYANYATMAAQYRIL
jgi:hypothetical protein